MDDKPLKRDKIPTCCVLSDHQTLSRRPRQGRLRSLFLALRAHIQVWRGGEDWTRSSQHTGHRGNRGITWEVVEPGCRLVVGGPGLLPKGEQARAESGRIGESTS